jgi:hypothetical protein
MLIYNVRLRTSPYDEESIYRTVPNLIRRLIIKDKPTAKDYLRSCSLSQDEFNLLNYMDQYTLEAIIVNVLSMVFTSLQEFSAVRASTLVERLDQYALTQAYLLKSRKSSNSKPNPTNNTEDLLKEEEDKGSSGKVKSYKKKATQMCAIGTHLVDFLLQRG